MARKPHEIQDTCTHVSMSNIPWECRGSDAFMLVRMLGRPSCTMFYHPLWASHGWFHHFSSFKIFKWPSLGIHPPGTCPWTKHPLRLRLARLARLVWEPGGKNHCFSRVMFDDPAEVRLMRFRMFRELKLMVLGLFSGLRALGRDPGPGEPTPLDGPRDGDDMSQVFLNH